MAPSFWTGRTGREIRRAGCDAQLIALYLVTAPSANMIGLYYLPLPTLCHDTGSPLQGASEALRRLSAIGFSHYDSESEHVWVPEMARFQIGEELKLKDKRIVGVVRELLSVRSCRFSRDFYDKYRQCFHLPDLTSALTNRSPSEAPPKPLTKPLRSQDQDQDQDQSLPSEESTAAAVPSALRAAKVVRRRDRKKPEASLKPPNPAHQVVSAFCATFNAKFGAEPVLNMGQAHGSAAHLIRIRGGDAAALAVVLAEVPAYFASTDPFTVKTGYSWGAFLNETNRRVVEASGAVPRSNGGRPPAKPRPGSTEAFAGETGGRVTL